MLTTKVYTNLLVTFFVNLCPVCRGWLRQLPAHSIPGRAGDEGPAPSGGSGGEAASWAQPAGAPPAHPESLPPYPGQTGDQPAGAESDVRADAGRDHQRWVVSSEASMCSTLWAGCQDLSSSWPPTPDSGAAPTLQTLRQTRWETFCKY